MSWDKESVHAAVEKQREYFKTGATLPVDFRRQMLLQLKQSVLAHEKDILAALKADLGRDESEGYLCDIGPVILEINEALHGLRKWVNPKLISAAY